MFKGYVPGGTDSRIPTVPAQHVRGREKPSHLARAEALSAKGLPASVRGYASSGPPGRPVSNTLGDNPPNAQSSILVSHCAQFCNTLQRLGGVSVALEFGLPTVRQCLRREMGGRGVHRIEYVLPTTPVLDVRRQSANHHPSWQSGSSARNRCWFSTPIRWDSIRRFSLLRTLPCWFAAPQRASILKRTLRQQGPWSFRFMNGVCRRWRLTNPSRGTRSVGPLGT